jgi:hypothetical protein
LSVNLDGGSICVDVFQRTDGTFGFDEFRRDPEDGRGWYSTRHLGHLVYATQDAALSAARSAIDWFDG